MEPSRKVAAAIRGNAQWQPAPSPVPHTVFDQSCINFVNSEFLDHVGSGRRYDRLVLPEWRRWFLTRCGIAGESSVRESELTELVGLRRRLRRLLDAQTMPIATDLASFNRILAAVPMRWHLTTQHSSSQRLQRRLVLNESGWRAAMAEIVSSYVELVVSGDLPRVKKCGNPNCSFLFFDSTRNATRRWCDSNMCGNLVKVRLYRSRRRATGRAGSSLRRDRSAQSQKRRIRARRSA